MAQSISFDTLSYAKKLIAAGVPEKQTEVHAEALAEMVDEQLVNKRDLKEMELRLMHALTLRMGAMIATSIAITVALIKVL